MITENLINSYLASGSAAFAEGQYQTAGKLFFAAYQKSKSFRKSDPRLAVVYANLALFYHQQKRYKKAETLLEQAIAIVGISEQFETALGENIRTQLCNAYMAQKKYSSVIRLYKNTLHKYQELGQHTKAPLFYDRIIDLYGALGKISRAEVWCKRAIKQDELHLNPGDPSARKRLVKLAWIYNEQNRTSEACAVYQKTVTPPSNSQFNASPY